VVPDMWPLVSAIQVLLLERRLRGPAPLPIASRRGFKPRVPTTLVSWTVTTKRSQMKGKRARSKFAMFFCDIVLSARERGGCSLGVGPATRM
jgi:hypothetical protein